MKKYIYQFIYNAGGSINIAASSISEAAKIFEAYYKRKSQNHIHPDSLKIIYAGEVIYE